VIETKLERLKYNLDNGIFIPAFDGNPGDKTLNELISLLENLANPQVLDVREELKKYGNEDPAKKFLKVQKKKREALAQKKGGIERCIKREESELGIEVQKRRVKKPSRGI